MTGLPDMSSDGVGRILSNGPARAASRSRYGSAESFCTLDARG